jgi:hypothetical protein
MNKIKLILMTISLLICGSNLASVNTLAQTKKNFSKGERYAGMSEQDKKQFISKEAEKILDKFGQTERDPIPAEGITLIKRFIDGYKKRIQKPRTNDCSQTNWLRSDLTSVLQRGREKAPMVAKAYREQDIDPTIGLYVAMVESEFCPCLQSPTGPLGMFQLTNSWGKLYGLDTKRGATPTDPDERCSPEKASGASALFFKFMIGYLQEKISDQYKNDGIGIPLAISAYNAGEGGLKKNVETVSNLNSSNNMVTIWDLVANKEKLSQQFQLENHKYFPKFMAAVIVGENPDVFGISEIKPLSEYFGKAISNPGKDQSQR